MNKYIVIAFAFLGVWFYEASGGSKFEPGENSLSVFADPKPIKPRVEPRQEMVARADTTAPITEVLPARASTEVEAEAADPTAGLTFVSMDVPLFEPQVVELETDSVANAEPTSEPVAVDVAEAPEPQVLEPVRDLRFVDGDRVNMRGGPGTDYAVVGKLLRNDLVEVLKDDGSGWLHLRDTATGIEGWMADWLVTASN